jgi:hypothetical protein
MKLTTRIDVANPDKKQYRWCAVNEHDRMLLCFFGTEAECKALDAKWKKTPQASALIAGEPRVKRTKLSVEITPCRACGDPIGHVLKENRGGGGTMHLLEDDGVTRIFHPPQIALDAKGKPIVGEDGEPVELPGEPMITTYLGCQIRLTD